MELHYHTRAGKPIEDWMNRKKGLKKVGICRNLVYEKKSDSIFCPLHPEKNKGKDLRLDHHTCDILHLCKTAFFFDLWDDDRKKHFMSFLRKKKKQGNLDWHNYSIGMADDSLLEEFEGLKWD